MTPYVLRTWSALAKRLALLQNCARYGATAYCTLPAMQIDESSLDGTIDVFSTIFRTALKITEDDIRMGVVVEWSNSVAIIDTKSKQEAECKEKESDERWI
ncbi:hypothetical protein B0H14DRAFT_2579397 [Mycena olivaceomarginata]|nr:hypothetical protein B0H14DRAFT_2579397 [Mycena olivaceomarginata]